MSLLQTPTRHSSDLNFRTWRFETSGGAPQLALTDMSPLTMDGSSFSKTHTSQSTPNLFHHNGTSLRNEYFTTPTPAQPIFNPRKVSDSSKLSPIPSPASQELSDENSPWCGAVGRASLGKSGRVIERLMADIDKLRRELTAEIAKRQEVEKREETNKGAMDAMLTESTNLRHAKEIDANAIRRRDRKIDELKTELEVERTRRLRAEAQSRDLTQQRDDVLAQCITDVSEAKEQAKQAEGNAEVLGRSHKQLGNEYRRRTEAFAKDLQHLTEDRDEERTKVKRLDIIVEQMRHELARTDKINVRMSEAFEEYKEGTELRMKNMEREAAAQQAADSVLRDETLRIVGEARWLINIGRNISKADYLPLQDIDLER